MALDGVSTRRAVLAGVGVALTGGGVVYGASEFGGSDGGSAAGVDVRASDRTITLSTSGPGSLDVDLTGNPLLGSSDAGVGILYWSDFQCPFCRRFEEETLPKLLDEYVEAGTVQIALFQFPYIGEGSHTAATAAKCVWRQVRDDAPGRYWDWHRSIFENQGKEGSGWATRENLLSITRSVDGVDAEAVGTCLDENADSVERSVNGDRTTGRELGVRGTPAFVLRNRESGTMGRMVGAQPYERFETAVTKIRNA
jgi:protein-disulfide isomerase